MTKNTNTKPVTTASIRTLVTKARAEFSKAEQSAQVAMIACANATYAVHTAGLIGKDQSANGGWDSLRDYAAGYVGRNGSAVGHSTVIMWRRIGRALSLGITPDATDARVALTFSRLTAVWGDKRVSDALDNGTKAAIVKAVASCFGKDGKKTPAPKATTDDTAGNKGTGETDGNTPDVPVTRNNSTTLDAVETLLARIAKPSKAEVARLVEIADRAMILAGLAPVAEETKVA